MIYVTQGHEKGIGLEVFLKSYLTLPDQQQKNFKLVCNKETLKENCKNMNLQTCFENIDCEFIDCKESSQTTSSIEFVLKKIQSNDVLITLPSSKDQIYFGNKSTSGHTDYFRKKFKNNFLVMSFFGPESKVMLLTDHINVNQITSLLDEKFILQKINCHLDHNKYYEIENVYISGINPHSGENGLIGNEDEVIKRVVSKLSNQHKNINIFGPISADTMHLQTFNSKTFFIYAHHDQGLGVFKTMHGLRGINMTLGLPFLRLSPDHGTAFHLYGKNTVNYTSGIYLLNKALEWHKND